MVRCTSARSWSTFGSFSSTGAGFAPVLRSCTPSTSKISTEWCATIARPASVTMSGCAMPASSQASWIEETTSLAYSCTV